MKISIIGAGKVGSSIAFSLLSEIKPNELVLTDIVELLLIAEELDLGHAAITLSPETQVKCSTDISETKDSDFIIITAGKAKTTEKTRADLAKTNQSIIESICKQVSEVAPDAQIIIVTNPSTQIADIARNACSNKVIAMDNQLDTSRLKYNIRLETGKNLDEIQSHVFGEHDDNMQFEIKDELTAEQLERVKHNTTHASKPMLAGKGYTNWGIAAQVTKLISELRD
jgi:malate dehydrogenase